MRAEKGLGLPCSALLGPGELLVLWSPVCSRYVPAGGALAVRGGQGTAPPGWALILQAIDPCPGGARCPPRLQLSGGPELAGPGCQAQLLQQHLLGELGGTGAALGLEGSQDRDLGVPVLPNLSPATSEGAVTMGQSSAAASPGSQSAYWKGTHRNGACGCGICSVCGNLRNRWKEPAQQKFLIMYLTVIFSV